MIQKNIVKSVDLSPKKTQGFVFGLGIERITILKHNISDIRLFHENNAHFLKQFQSKLMCKNIYP